MITNAFFQETLEQSRVKSRIVSKYFDTWSRIMTSKVRNAQSRLAYVDLFAGPGSYGDGTPSTPLLILESAVADSELRKRLVTIFNDKDAKHCACLKKAISDIPGIETLMYAPQVDNEEVGSKIVERLQSVRLVPTLSFMDPWGYKGLSLDLINSVIKDWACECIFFFNYKRINSGLTNRFVEPHMNQLFGQARAAKLRAILPAMDPKEREETILDEMTAALKETYGKYVLTFRFMDRDSDRTSHYIVFVTKNYLGYEIMKERMGKESQKDGQGVPLFEFDEKKIGQLMLSGVSPAMDSLISDLPTVFAGRTLTMKQVYDDHNVGTKYIKKNYKAALTTLLADGRISTNRTRLRSGTFGDDVTVTFPA